MVLTFEKKVTKNQEMRIKYPENPEKYEAKNSFVLNNELMLSSQVKRDVDCLVGSPPH